MLKQLNRSISEIERSGAVCLRLSSLPHVDKNLEAEGNHSGKLDRKTAYSSKRSIQYKKLDALHEGKFVKMYALLGNREENRDKTYRVLLRRET